MKNIMVPVESVKTAEPAIQLAAMIAGRNEGAVHLVSVLPESRDDLRRELEDRARRVTAETSVECKAEPLAGEVAATLVTYAALNDVDLLVIPAHRRGQLRRATLGSVADELVRDSGLPVLICNRGDGGEGPSQPPVEVLIPVHERSDADAIIRAAFETAGPEARYTLLRVVEPADVLAAAHYAAALVGDPRSESELNRFVRNYLDALQERYTREGYTIKTAAVAALTPSAGILDYAGSNSVELIAIATRGEHGIARWMNGSTASDVVQRTRFPVLVLARESDTAVRDDLIREDFSGNPEYSALTQEECQRILDRNHVGRLAYNSREGVQIAPLHYVADDGWIFGRTSPGEKLAALEHDWNVAFEVDEIAGPFDWKSVVVRGGFYTISDLPVQQATRARALELLRRIAPDTLQPGDPAPHRTVLFSIRVRSITGRASSSRNVA